jgi:hypothetical protein
VVDRPTKPCPPKLVNSSIPVVPVGGRQLSRARSCPGGHTPLRSEESLIGSAWWLCIAELRDAMATRAAVRWGLRLFALAGVVLMAGYLCLISEHAGGWNLITLGLATLGYLGVSSGFWVATNGRKVEIPFDSRIPVAVRS